MIQIPVILFTLGFAAAIVNPEASLHPQPAAEQPEKPEVAVNALAAPARITATLPENILDAKQAATIALDYTPGDEQTWYFDHDGNPTETASPGGYYRKALGQTADGRRVVQDYHQDNNAPQTAPFILKNDSDPHDFNGDNADSKTVWYRKDGSIEAVQDYRDGAHYGRLNIYQNGRLAAQMPLDDSRSDTEDDPYRGDPIASGLRLYHPNGKPLGYIHADDDGRAEITYREDGSPVIATLRTPDGKLSEISSWDKDGNAREDGPDFEEIKALETQRQRLLELVGHLEFMNDAPPQKTLPAPAPQPALLPESVLDAKQATNLTLDYSAETDGETWHFDPHGNPTKTASTGGYYRKALGKTADGRRVVQDYYQDSNTPQTAPFILKKDADPHNFENDTADSSVIWYRKDGSTYAVQAFKNGEPQSRMNIYQDGRLVAQMPRPQGLDESTDPYRSAGDLADGLRLYHSSGHLLYLSQHYANQNDETLYDSDGNPLAAYRSRQGEPPALWSVLDEQPDKQTAIKEALQRREQIENMIAAESVEAPGETEPEKNTAPAVQQPPAPAAKPEASEPATSAAQPATELLPPPVGEGGGGVSPQTTAAEAPTAEQAPPVPNQKPDSKYNLGGINLPETGLEPDTLDAPAPQTARLPATVLDAKQAAENPIDYTPAPEADQYADRDGKPTDQPVPGGYLRKTLGKTADGRRVVQDYYQDSNTPQTAPFTLKKDADPRDYTTGAVDGKITWYRPDGSILAIQQYRNGAPASRLNHYRDGRLAVQSELPAGVTETDDPYSSVGEANQGRRYYYESGQLLALESGNDNPWTCEKQGCEGWAILYDAAGQPLAAYHGERTNDIVFSKYWNTLNHTPADEQTARRQTFDAALERLHELRQMQQQDSLTAP
ncbi:hypothetical protein [Cardiobacterium hominis]|uniref:hypothetical protein n=1 Tax=Cardiobacterium hominis TaxID=2718 RepID=UPI0028D26BA6|nr:hypothetical protein [Cardiobacterium hominis]